MKKLWEYSNEGAMCSSLRRAAFVVSLAAAIVMCAACTRGDLFATEAAASQHCPTDVVVWLNTNSGIFHFRGERWYGRTDSGGYICERDAEADGDRPTRNGQ